VGGGEGLLLGGLHPASAALWVDISSILSSEGDEPGYNITFLFHIFFSLKGLNLLQRFYLIGTRDASAFFRFVHIIVKYDVEF
jgi:hypothetical protein